MNQEFRESLVADNRLLQVDKVQHSINNKTDSEHSGNGLNKAYTYFLFFVILLVNMLINFDHGVMPAGAVEMKLDLVLSNTEFGWLGSVVFIGLTLGKCYCAGSLLKIACIIRLNMRNIHVLEMEFKAPAPLRPTRQCFFTLPVYTDKGLQSLGDLPILHRLFPNFCQYLLPCMG